MGAAIKATRRKLGISQEKAAEIAGVTPVTWRRYEWGERALDLGKIAHVAQALGVERDDLLILQAKLLEGQTLADIDDSAPGTPLKSRPAISPAYLPIRDRIQAGAWLAADDFIQDGRTYPAMRDTRYPHAQQWLSEVQGDSMNLLNIMDGDLVHCLDIEDADYKPRHMDIVEVERLRFGGHERELTLKQVEATPSGLVLWPRSTNPRWQTPIDLRDGLSDRESETDVVVKIRSVVLASIRRFRRD